MEVPEVMIDDDGTHPSSRSRSTTYISHTIHC